MHHKRSIQVLGEELFLDANRAMFWPRHKTLVLADLHLGKSTHFRREGIGVPSGLLERELMRMDQLIHDFESKTALFLGDLFHSSHNREWTYFCAWMHHYAHIRGKGKAKLSETLACFVFGSERATLPAFRRFTGKSLKTPCEGDRIFVLTLSVIFDFST